MDFTCAGIQWKGGRLTYYTDGIFAIVFCIFVIFGYKRGLLKGLVAILSLVFGLVLATRSMSGLGDLINRTWDVREVVGAVLAFVIVFLGVVVLQVVVLVIIHRRSEPPGSLSRFCGAVLGLVEAAIYLSVVLIILNFYSLPSSQTRDRSVMYKPIREFAPLVFDRANYFLSGKTTFYEEVKKSFEKFRLAPND